MNSKGCPDGPTTLLLARDLRRNVIALLSMSMSMYQAPPTPLQHLEVTHDVGPERVTGARRSSCPAARQRNEDRSPALNDHPTVPATSVELGSRRGRHLPGQPRRQ